MFTQVYFLLPTRQVTHYDGSNIVFDTETNNPTGDLVEVVLYAVISLVSHSLQAVGFPVKCLLLEDLPFVAVVFEEESIEILVIIGTQVCSYFIILLICGLSASSSDDEWPQFTISHATDEIVHVQINAHHTRLI